MYTTIKSSGLGLLFLTLLSAASLQAQSLSPQIVHVAGGYAQVDTGCLPKQNGSQNG